MASERLRRDGPGSPVGVFLLGDRNEQVERRLPGDMVEQLGAEVFGVGHDQRAVGLPAEDLPDDLQQFRCGTGDGSRRAARGEAHRLAGVGVEAEEGLGRLAGGCVGAGLPPAAVALV